MMSRTICALAALFLAAAALAAPAPQHLPAGLSKFVDPHRDCTLRRDKDALVIEMPGGDHDYDPLRERVSAPRLLRDLEGDFIIQFRVRIDSHSSFEESFNGRPSFIAGGLLLIPPENYGITCIRLEFASAGRGIGAYGYAAFIHKDTARGYSNAIWSRQWKDWPLPNETDHAYLRLERRGTTLYPYLSPDGEKWTLLVGGAQYGRLPAKLKVGLAAYSTSGERSKVRFDLIKLTQGKKKGR